MNLKHLFVALVFTVVSASAGVDCDDDRDDSEALVNGASDVVVVRQADGTLRATPMQVQVGKFANWRTLWKSREGRLVDLTINDIESPLKMTITDSGNACFSRPGVERYTFTSVEWEHFNLHAGGNLATYKVPSLGIEIRFIVYLFEQTTRLVLTDIDGTITLSDIKGKVLPYFGGTADHEGVVELFQGKMERGLQMVYLTARSMGDDSDTREYLFKTLQDLNGFSLPYGPVFMSPKPIAEAALEGLTNPEKQKTETLTALFELFDFGPESVDTAYGNRDSDTTAYLASGVAPEKIFVVDEESVLRNVADGRRTSYRMEAEEEKQEEIEFERKKQ